MARRSVSFLTTAASSVRNGPGPPFIYLASPTLCPSGFNDDHRRIAANREHFRQVLVLRDQSLRLGGRGREIDARQNQVLAGVFLEIIGLKNLISIFLHHSLESIDVKVRKIYRFCWAAIAWALR